MMSDYRKIIEDADAARQEASRQQMEAEQRRTATVRQAMHKAKTWYEEVFLKEVASANEQMVSLNAKFVIENTQTPPGGLVSHFHFVRHQRKSDRYTLTVNGETFSLSQSRETSPPGGGVRNPNQRLQYTKVNVPEMQPFVKLHIGGDDAIVSEMLEKIIEQSVK